VVGAKISDDVLEALRCTSKSRRIIALSASMRSSGVPS
jgi:hypothetical protein